MNQKSVQARGLLGHFSKPDHRYWQQRIFRESDTRGTKALLMKIQVTMKTEHVGTVPEGRSY